MVTGVGRAPRRLDSSTTLTCQRRHPHKRSRERSRGSTIRAGVDCPHDGKGRTVAPRCKPRRNDRCKPDGLLRASEAWMEADACSPIALAPRLFVEVLPTGSASE